MISGSQLGLREEQVAAYDNLAVEQRQSLDRLQRDWPYLKGGSSGYGHKQGGHQQPQNTATMISYKDQQCVPQKATYGYVTNLQSQHGVKETTQYGQTQHGIHQKPNYGQVANYHVQHGIQQNTNYDELVNDQTRHGHSQLNHDGEIMSYQSQHSVKGNLTNSELANQEAYFILYQLALQAPGNYSEL